MSGASHVFSLLLLAVLLGGYRYPPLTVEEIGSQRSRTSSPRPPSQQVLELDLRPSCVLPLPLLSPLRATLSAGALRGTP